MWKISCSVAVNVKTRIHKLVSNIIFLFLFLYIVQKNYSTKACWKYSRNQLVYCIVFLSKSHYSPPMEAVIFSWELLELEAVGLHIIQWVQLWWVPKILASSMVCGKTSSAVSGSKRPKTIAIIQRPPYIRIGVDGWTLLAWKKKRRKCQMALICLNFEKLGK